MGLVDVFRGKIVDISEHSLTVEVLSLIFFISAYKSLLDFFTEYEFCLQWNNTAGYRRSWKNNSSDKEL